MHMPTYSTQPIFHAEVTGYKVVELMYHHCQFDEEEITDSLTASGFIEFQGLPRKLVMCLP